MIVAVLAALLVAGYFIELGSGGDTFCAAYGLVPAHATVRSALTATFLHDPSNGWHLVGNLVFLIGFGLLVERELGSLRFGVLYALSGLGAAALHVLANPVATTPMVGASGPIFGVLAAAAMLRPRLLGFVGAYTAFNIWQVVTGTGGTVAVAAHVGGFATGFLMTVCLRPSEEAA